MAGYLGPSSGGEAGAGGIEVFRWNHADTSQFEAAAVFADGSGAATLTVVTSAWGNPALRFTGTAGTAACVSWYAVDAIPYTGDRRDLVVQIEALRFTGGGGGYVGMFLGSGTGASFYALQQYCASSPNSEWASRVEAGTRVTSGSTGTGLQNAGFFAQYTWRGYKTSGQQPYIASYMSGNPTFNDYTGDVRRSGITANLGNAADFGDGSAYGAGWNSPTLDRWGLSIQSSGGNALPSNWDILDLRVYMLPE